MIAVLMSLVVGVVPADRIQLEAENVAILSANIELDCHTNEDLDWVALKMPAVYRNMRYFEANIGDSGASARISDLRRAMMRTQEPCELTWSLMRYYSVLMVQIR